MKTHIITISLFLAALSFTSCKKNEASATRTPSTTPAATTPTTSTVAPAVITTRDSVKTDEKGEKGENEANEKNERE